MFERFTERARQVVVLAQDEARSLGHNVIGTEHLLLGLIREEEGIAARTLDALGVVLPDVRALAQQLVGAGDDAATGQIPFTPRAKKTLELSLREALALGHNHADRLDELAAEGWELASTFVHGNVLTAIFKRPGA